MDDMEMVFHGLHEAKGWPGLLGSLDRHVMQLEWKNCPKAHRR